MTDDNIFDQIGSAAQGAFSAFGSGVNKLSTGLNALSGQDQDQPPAPAAPPQLATPPAPVAPAALAQTMAPPPPAAPPPVMPPMGTPPSPAALDAMGVPKVVPQDVSDIVFKALNPAGWDKQANFQRQQIAAPMLDRQYKLAQDQRTQDTNQLADAAGSGDLVALTALRGRDPTRYDAISKTLAPNFAGADMQKGLDLSITRLQRANSLPELDQAKMTIEQMFPASKPVLDRYSGAQLKSMIPIFQDWKLAGAAHAEAQQAQQRELSGFVSAPKDVAEQNADAFLNPAGDRLAAPMLRHNMTGDVGLNVKRAVQVDPKTGEVSLKPGVPLVGPDVTKELTANYNVEGKDLLKTQQDVNRLGQMLDDPNVQKGPMLKQHVFDVLAKIGAGGKATTANIKLAEDAQSLSQQFKNWYSKNVNEVPLSPELHGEIRNFISAMQPELDSEVANRLHNVAYRAGAGNVSLEAIAGKDAASEPHLAASYKQGQDALKGMLTTPEVKSAGLLKQSTFVPANGATPPSAPAAALAHPIHRGL
jgi:hypothetical protein